MKTCLVFGGNGAIGSATADLFRSLDFSVWTTSRSAENKQKKVVLITGDIEVDAPVLSQLPIFDAVVWAQGVNQNDSISTFDSEGLRSVLEANTVFVAATMSALVNSERVVRGSRLCIISSIWQEIIRENKFSYSISKAAVGALVRSAATDLSSRGMFVNAVLPGVLDTPMTRSMLKPEQLSGIEESTGFARLVTPLEIAQAVHFLCSDMNNGISGQSIVVDLGFSNVKNI